MTDLVRSSQIEKIIGVKRHPIDHYARAVSAEQTVYILHSARCHREVTDLRGCPFSIALDSYGIDVSQWTEDAPTVVSLREGRMVPG